MKKNWYAVFTRLDREKKVAALLHKRKLEYYLPLNSMVQKGAAKEKVFCKPLFPSCVFVRTTETELPLLKRIEGVISLLYWLSKPAVIKDTEMEMLQVFLSEHKTVSSSKITVNFGGFSGLSKELIRVNGSKLVKSGKEILILPSLGYVLSPINEPSAVIEKGIGIEAEFYYRSISLLN